MPDSDGNARTAAPGTTAVTVTADDLHESVRAALAALRGQTEADWSVRAGSLEWDCWDTVEHLSDDLFAYAAQLTPDNPPSTDGIPFRYAPRTPGGPVNGVFADKDAGPAGLLRVLEACGALLEAMVRTAPPGLRAWHPFGVADAGGFAAMGVVETLVHVYDVAEGIGFPWEPPEEPCRRALARLFPDVSVDAPPWPALLWATGRTELPGLPRRTSWRWYGEPPPPRDTATAATTNGNTAGSTAATAPLLLLDVDGPLNPFATRLRRRPHGYTTHRFKPADWVRRNAPLPEEDVKWLRVWLRAQHGRQLTALPYELVWATTWMHDANTHIAPVLGLPELPVIEWAELFTPGPDGTHWKARHIVEWARGRPFAWVDDGITDHDRRYVSAHHDGPALLHWVSPRRGLRAKDFATLRSWAGRQNR